MGPETKFSIVAIGLSAGGYAPLWRFFDHLPPTSGMAFIVIQHLNRAHVSIADQLLAKHTAMPVCWATHQQQVKPNGVYLLPINKVMTLQGGYLLLHDRPVGERTNWAVDIFFKSLAIEKKAAAIGIILSGAGSDGTLGAVAIHQEQGLVLVQDPQTAEFTSMPRSAILTGHPTLILSPKRLAHALLEFVSTKATDSNEHKPV